MSLDSQSLIIPIRLFIGLAEAGSKTPLREQIVVDFLRNYFRAHHVIRGKLNSVQVWRLRRRR